LPQLAQVSTRFLDNKKEKGYGPGRGDEMAGAAEVPKPAYRYVGAKWTGLTGLI
jgi:hypothetical protein